MRFILFAAFFFLSACSTGPGAERLKAATESEKQGNARPFIVPKPVLAWSKVKGSEKWTDLLLQEVDDSNLPDVLPADIKDWCPSYQFLPRIQKSEFYAHLLSIMAKHESGYDTNTKYGEAFKDAKGEQVISRGLLQISQESANSDRYKCGIKKASELHDAKTNLSCGVKILSYWITQDKQVAAGKTSATAKGAARYWAVMRSEKLDKKTKKWMPRKSFNQIKTYMQALPMCKGA